MSQFAETDKTVVDVQKEHARFIKPLGDWRRSHSCNELSIANNGETVCLMGWVQYRRDHGGLIFVDLRDREGLTQVVFSPEVAPEAHGEAHVIRSEYVMAIKGRVRPRPEGMANPNLHTGEIEVVVLEWKLLNTAKTPPFLVEERSDCAESLRMQYRYLDLRRANMAKNLRVRHNIVQACRNYLNELGFLDVETPMLTKSTPEGARDCAGGKPTSQEGQRRTSPGRSDHLPHVMSLLIFAPTFSRKCEGGVSKSSSTGLCPLLTMPFRAPDAVGGVVL